MREGTIYLIAGAALVYYAITQKKAPVPAPLTGPGANSLEAAKQDAASFDPGQLQSQLALQGAKASVLTNAIKANPALGFAAGFGPQQVDYLVLPPAQYRSIYGFNPPT